MVIANLLLVEQKTRWEIMRKLLLPEINLGPGNYTYCDLIRYVKLFNAASILNDIKDSDLQIYAFCTMKIF